MLLAEKIHDMTRSNSVSIERVRAQHQYSSYDFFADNLLTDEMYRWLQANGNEKRQFYNWNMLVYRIVDIFSLQLSKPSRNMAEVWTAIAIGNWGLSRFEAVQRWWVDVVKHLLALSAMADQPVLTSVSHSVSNTAPREEKVGYKRDRKWDTDREPKRTDGNGDTEMSSVASTMQHAAKKPHGRGDFENAFPNEFQTPHLSNMAVGGQSTRFPSNPHGSMTPIAEQRYDEEGDAIMGGQ